MPDLQKWHDANLSEDFTREDYQRFTSFADYLNQEQKLISTCYEKVKPEDKKGYNRFILCGMRIEE